MKNKENDMMDFTQGSILKKLLRFMVPILGALILQAAYGAVDLLVVGRFGSTSGLSGVSTGSQVLNLVTFAVTYCHGKGEKATSEIRRGIFQRPASISGQHFRGGGRNDDCDHRKVLSDYEWEESDL